MSIRCLDDEGRGNVADVSKAIEYAMSNGAKIINMSWRSNKDIPVIREIIDYAYQQGCILVGASGNDNTTSPFYPAGYGSVTAVYSINENDRKSLFSNYGEWIDISAPGKSILSTVLSSSYDYGDGTSFSAPYVSALTGLFLSQNPGWTNDEVIARIKKTADNIDSFNPGYENKLGIGRINLLRALGIPKIALILPSSGSVGNLITINGINFDPEVIRIDFGQTISIQFTQTDTSGNFSTTFTADTQPYRMTTINAYGFSSRAIALVTFTITARARNWGQVRGIAEELGSDLENGIKV